MNGSRGFPVAFSFPFPLVLSIVVLQMGNIQGQLYPIKSDIPKKIDLFS